MKTILIITNLIIMILTTAACSPTIEISEMNELPAAKRLPDSYVSMLPENYEIPSQLPSTIKDPLILTAWVFLYNQQETIYLYDNEVLTGRNLALYVIEGKIPVKWGSDKICNGNSCSARPICRDADCISNLKVEKAYPVFLSLRYQDTNSDTLPALAGSIAHELFHHTLPFGAVDASLYEEYWAFYVGAQIEKADWANFTGYQPLNSACLKQWFRMHDRTGYFGIDMYPFTLQASTDLISPMCSQ